MNIQACNGDSSSLDRNDRQAHQGFYAIYGKRSLDIVASACGLLLLCPVFAIVALSIKLTSPGPVVFRQIRIGRKGRPFKICKFRSMFVQDANPNFGITVAGDPRITRVGRWLRRFKLDELPQLWNVLRGDMSLVGPRPELPALVAGYTQEQRAVLSVRPGITDPSSIVYRNEEEILAANNDPERFYSTQILPDKLERSRSYLQDVTFFNDLHIIRKTLSSSFLNKAQGI
jgi:lipopolysaccharide/colanic/teichoic acid biosynthesis glycosyltransferase